ARPRPGRRPAAGVRGGLPGLLPTLAGDGPLRAGRQRRGLHGAARRLKLFFCRFVPFRDFGPVHYVPPRRDVVQPPVLILEVVGVLPHVEPEHRDLPIHERAVLVRRTRDLELTARDGEPRPAASEPAGGGGGQLLLERAETAERLP